MPVTVCNFVQNRRFGGKFVVLRPMDGGDGGYFLISDFSRDYHHVDIVKRWLTGRHPTLDAAGLNAAGGGWWKMLADNELELYGQSYAYGRYQAVWLREQLKAGDVFGESGISMR